MSEGERRVAPAILEDAVDAVEEEENAVHFRTLRRSISPVRNASTAMASVRESWSRNIMPFDST